MTTALEKAERDLNNLEEQRESIASRAALLDKQRKSIAFAALTAGDKRSKERLAEINAEDIVLTTNVASVEAALAVARANLETAKDAEAQAIAAKRSAEYNAKITELNAKLKEQLEDADAAFADAIASVLSARALLLEMHTLGVGSPTDQLFRINTVTAIKSALQNLPSPYISDFEFSRLAPNQKKTFRDLAAGWCTQIGNLLPKKEAA